MAIAFEQALSGWLLDHLLTFHGSERSSDIVLCNNMAEVVCQGSYLSTRMCCRLDSDGTEQGHRLDSDGTEQGHRLDSDGMEQGDNRLDSDGMEQGHRLAWNKETTGWTVMAWNNKGTG